MTAVQGTKWYLKKYQAEMQLDDAICFRRRNMFLLFKADCMVFTGPRFKWETPYPFTPCVCDKCGTFSKHLTHTYLDFKTRGRNDIIYNFFCKRCYRKTRRIWKRSIEAQENKSIINKLRKEINNVRRQDKPNQDNGTASGIFS